jgi:hypothetical protein
MGKSAIATSDEERMILVHQLTHLTDWSEEVGDYIGIPLFGSLLTTLGKMYHAT